MTAEEWNRKLCKCRRDEDENEEQNFFTDYKETFLDLHSEIAKGEENFLLIFS